MPHSTARAGALLLVMLVAIGGIAAGCDSATPASPNQVSGCAHWCGNGSARVTLAGTTTEIDGGGCYDQGAGGFDVRFGDWQDEGPIDYLSLTAYQAGGPTPPPTETPVPTSADASDSPEPTDPPDYNVGGSVDGQPFVLDVGAAITLGADGKGTFSGIDVNGLGEVSGTFTCN
jgi:hypothetical protein